MASDALRRRFAHDDAEHVHRVASERHELDWVAEQRQKVAVALSVWMAGERGELVTNDQQRFGVRRLGRSR